MDYWKTRIWNYFNALFYHAVKDSEVLRGWHWCISHHRPRQWTHTLQRTGTSFSTNELRCKFCSNFLVPFPFAWCTPMVRHLNHIVLRLSCCDVLNRFWVSKFLSSNPNDAKISCSLFSGSVCSSQIINQCLSRRRKSHIIRFQLFVFSFFLSCIMTKAVIFGCPCDEVIYLAFRKWMTLYCKGLVGNYFSPGP